MSNDPKKGGGNQPTPTPTPKQRPTPAPAAEGFEKHYNPEVRKGVESDVRSPKRPQVDAGEKK